MQLQAASAITGAGSGSLGIESKDASSMIPSDPHNPHLPTDVEIVLQA